MSTGMKSCAATEQDSCLPADIVPGDTSANRGGTVLLTGATGFLGRQMLYELLAGGARVICIVRAANDEEARNRLMEASYRSRVLSLRIGGKSKP